MTGLARPELLVEWSVEANLEWEMLAAQGSTWYTHSQESVEVCLSVGTLEKCLWVFVTSEKFGPSCRVRGPFVMLGENVAGSPVVGVHTSDLLSVFHTRGPRDGGLPRCGVLVVPPEGASGWGGL